MIPLKKLHRVVCLRTLPSVFMSLVMFTVLYHLPKNEHYSPQKVADTNSTPRTVQIHATEDVPSKSDLSWLSTSQDFFERLQSSSSLAPCRRQRAMGGSSCHRIVDGQKQLCLDQDVLLHPRNCTVYSFGVADEITFDTAMSSYGCQVYLLDPTLPPDAYKDLGPKMTFYPYGLHSVNKVIPINLTIYEEWQGVLNTTLLTFDQVQQKLGHSAPPDYLKLDIEGAEWYVLPYMMDRRLLDGIKQIAVEIHVNASKFETPEGMNYLSHLWAILERLGDHGFQRAHYEPTRSFESLYTVPGTNVSFNTCGELFLIRRSRTR